jgi:thymidylate synthase (FAD)
MRITLIARTEFLADAAAEVMQGWTTDADGGQALCEAAGRACFQSFKKPNPATATNAGYLAHIREVGHESVLEHGSVSFYIEGVSRSLTHELVRHRHFSFSQLSQRYVAASNVEFVPPPLIAEDPKLLNWWQWAVVAAREEYVRLLGKLEDKLAELPASTGKKKQVRQAARSLLPNATETKIVVTGNYRAWRHFIKLRATETADVEIRALAIECLRQLKQVAPNVFDDFAITSLTDGTEVAA